MHKSLSQIALEFCRCYDNNRDISVCGKITISPLYKAKSTDIKHNISIVKLHIHRNVFLFFFYFIIRKAARDQKSIATLSNDIFFVKLQHIFINIKRFIDRARPNHSNSWDTIAHTGATMHALYRHNNLSHRNLRRKIPCGRFP